MHGVRPMLYDVISNGGRPRQVNTCYLIHASSERST